MQHIMILKEAEHEEDLKLHSINYMTSKIDEPIFND